MANLKLKTKTKDPAVLWYYGHYLYGTRYMSFQEKGAYAELLNVQADKGALDYRDGFLTIDCVREILEKELQNEWEKVWNKVKNKFTEKDGVFFNERMRAEQEKRQGYCKSRSKNGKHKKSIPEAHADHTEKKDEAYATNQINSNQIKSNNLLKKEEETPKGNTSSPESSDSLSVFEKVRYSYLGIKRGKDTEFQNFKKKTRDWKEVLPKLLPALENQIKWRDEMAAAGMFVPNWRYFRIWINQRGWEDQKPDIVQNPNKRAAPATSSDIKAQAERVELS